jgi:hypothetical protein
MHGKHDALAEQIIGIFYDVSEALLWEYFEPI